MSCGIVNAMPHAQQEVPIITLFFSPLFHSHQCSLPLFPWVHWVFWSCFCGSLEGGSNEIENFREKMCTTGWGTADPIHLKQGCNICKYFKVQILKSCKNKVSQIVWSFLRQTDMRSIDGKLDGSLQRGELYNGIGWPLPKPLFWPSKFYRDLSWGFVELWRQEAIPCSVRIHLFCNLYWQSCLSWHLITK